MAHYDLVVEQRYVEQDIGPQRDVEVLERNREQVLAVQIAKGGGGRFAGTVVLDSAQIRVDVHVHTGSSSCSQPVSNSFGSAVRSSTRFSSTRRLLGGLERSARSARATRRIA